MTCRRGQSRHTECAYYVAGTLRVPCACRSIVSRRRCGLTLIELIFSALIMAMVAAALAAASHGVQLANESSQGYGTAAQHARVAIERIRQSVEGAIGNLNYPGLWVTQDTAGTWTYPNTLIVWQPSGTPANPAGPPLAQELTIFCPDPAAPSDLIQLTVPGDTRSVPTTDATALKSFIDGLKTSSTANKIQLTTLLRVATPSGSVGAQASQQAAVRFVVTMNPSASDWAAYSGGKTAWSNLPWPQGIFGSSKGIRQVWVRTELQLMPGATWIDGNPGGEIPIPFLGSATLAYGIP
ncbi:MAG TPA: prepilin-type N-terminal cleavage/methylation domain-containing protein [Pirellulales bacterium]